MNDRTVKQIESPAARPQVKCGAVAIANAVPIDLEDALAIDTFENEGGLTFNPKHDEPTAKEI